MNQRLKNRFREALLAWYAASKRDLPWRRTDDPYRIWLSEAMLQQTQVARVVEYYHRFLNELPDVRALAEADEEKVLKLWEGLGYYSRARNLHRAAKRMVERHGGVVPSTYDELLELPGFGAYTAAAVSSIAFGEKRAVIDGNVNRVVARLRAREVGDDVLRQTAVVAAFVAAAIPADRPGDFNQAMMELGATVCRPRNPLCAQCPVSGSCDAARDSTQTSYPLRKTKPARPVIEEAALVIECDGALLFKQRVGVKLLGGLWEFPSVVIADDEAPLDAAVRLARKLGLNAGVTPLTRLTHVFTHLVQDLHIFKLESAARITAPEFHHWATPADLDRLPLTRAAQRILGAKIKKSPK
jgi:A/G-specific adenine glycosylase